MAKTEFIRGLMAVSGLLWPTIAQKDSKEDLILCDCGIGDNKDHPEWSTSRQINWYRDIKWPDSAFEYPAAPQQVVQVPYNDGIYPWIADGVTATLPNGEVWTAYIEDGTPDGFKAGTAVTTKEGGQTLNCWAYRGRPVSAALNRTVTDDAICWTAFVCNRDEEAPQRPDDMSNPTSHPATTSAPPATSSYSTNPGTVTTTAPSGDTTTTTAGEQTTTTNGQPQPTQNPKAGALFLDAAVNPRFVNWPNNWQSFINNFVWDQTTGKCVGPPARGDGYNMTFECAGIQLDQDSHMTLLMIKALRDVGLTSQWFNQNPTVPPGTGHGNMTSWVVMPEAFSLTAFDAATSHAIGYISYKTEYGGFLAGPCSTCERSRFDKAFFDPIIGAMQGTYPSYWSYTVQGQCKPWMVCK